MNETAGLQGMVTVSILAHAVLLVVVLFAPQRWFARSAEAPRTVMTITLEGGGEGPRNGGLTAIGGRPVQAVTPPDAKREAIRPPAAKTPEMTMPAPNAK